MAVSKADFIDVARQYGCTEQEAVADHDFMASGLIDLAKMTRVHLEKFYKAKQVLQIDDKKRSEQELRAALRSIMDIGESLAKR